MASQCYYDGDFWAATEDVSAGETPSASSKWRRLEIPAQFERVLILSAVSQVEMHRGQHEKSSLVVQQAAEALDLAIVEEARTHSRSHQPQVFTR